MYLNPGPVILWYSSFCKDCCQDCYPNVRYKRIMSSLSDIFWLCTKIYVYSLIFFIISYLSYHVFFYHFMVFFTLVCRTFRGFTVPNELQDTISCYKHILNAVVHVYTCFAVYFWMLANFNLSCRCVTARPCRDVQFFAKNFAKNNLMAKSLQPCRFGHKIQQPCKFEQKIPKKKLPVTNGLIQGEEEGRANVQWL